MDTITSELTKMTPYEEKIFKLLPIGNEHPITAREIERLTNIDERNIRDYIYRIIEKYEVPICASRIKPYGYYIADSKQSALEGTIAINNQLNAMKNRINIVRNADIEAIIRAKREIS